MNFQKHSFGDLQDRVLRLEKQNNRLKQFGVAALIAAASLFIMGQTSRKKTIEANEFILRDTRGNVRARLDVDDKTVGAALSLYVKNGDLALALSSMDSVGGSLTLSHGKEMLLLTSSDVDFVHSEDEKTSRLKGELSSNMIFLSDDQGFATHIGANDITIPSTGEAR